MAVIRFLFALLLGFLLGAGTTVYLIKTGAGDLVIRHAEVVQDLERRLREVEQQRDQVGRQLEDMVARSAKMENAFSELERRFHEMEREVDGARAGHDQPPAAAPAPAR